MFVSNTPDGDEAAAVAAEVATAANAFAFHKVAPVVECNNGADAETSTDNDAEGPRASGGIDGRLVIEPLIPASGINDEELPPLPGVLGGASSAEDEPPPTPPPPPLGEGKAPPTAAESAWANAITELAIDSGESGV